MAACHAQGAEHLILTGDLIDGEIFDHQDEARACREILLDHGYHDHRSATVIPGNHDLHGDYGLPGDPATSERNLSLFFRFFGRFLRQRSVSPRFPIVKRIGRLTVYCLNSICPRAGRWDFRYLLPRSQVRSLVRAFGHAGSDPKIVVVHHYPYRIGWGHVGRFGLLEWLEDRFWLPLRGWRRLVRACARHGVRYILHGHSHTSRMVGFRGSDLLALGQGLTGDGRQFSIYDIPPAGVGSRSLLRLIGHRVEQGPVEPIAAEFLVDGWSARRWTRARKRKGRS